MLNVIIQNDGKIKARTECSNTKEMRSNVKLLLAIVSSIEAEEKANKEDNDIPAQAIYYLYLNRLGYNELDAAKELVQQLNIPLRNAKAIVDTVADGREALISQSTDKLFIENIKEALKSKGCVCEITKG